MEKRIKALYIVTIAAILAFLGMQAYWLYGRYFYSLSEYERSLTQKITESVDLYNGLRDIGKKTKYSCDSIGQKLMFPVISLSISKDDTVRTSRRVSIYTYSYHRILGLDSNTSLTQEMREKALNNIYDHKRYNKDVASDSVHYDASQARDENETWAAAHNVVTARNMPFTKVGVDSVLRKNGIEAQIMIAQVDSMVWNKSVRHYRSLWNPRLSVSVPYSQLEGKVVEITCRINPFDVLPMMWPTLIVVLLITVLLIICLILQIITVLKLSRLDKMRNSFVTTMIHELKRPISTLKMCVSGLENEKMMADPDIRKEMLSETRLALDNLSAYFSKLRDITFNAVEQIPLNHQIMNIHGLFAKVSESIVIPVGKSVEFINDIDVTLEVSADPTHLFNILNNLVENALKYSGSQVEVKAEATVNNGFVEIGISDTGNGIPSDDLKHIFKRFYRGKATGSEVPGMGLGLAYVKLLIDAHGGDITVESIYGKGTRFIIRLPH